MKQYIYIAIATVLFLNLALTVFIDIRDARELDQKIVLPNTPNLTAEVTASLQEMRNDETFAYEAFVGWQAWEQTGQYINIDKEGVRHTVGQPLQFEEQVLLFGGSTMWGWGVGDENTIPSHVQSLIKEKRVVNLGEISYNATQGLNRLLLHLTKHPDVRGAVVFYDGINEILSSCSGLNGPYGQAMTNKIKSAIETQRRNRIVGLLDDLFLTQTRKAAIKVKGLLDPIQLENCSNSEEYANKVADRLVTSWRAAAAIASEYGLKFIAILQPTPYSDSKLTQARLVRDDWKNGIEAIYPRVADKAKHFKWFQDGRDWFDGRDVYVDACCHVNGETNAFLAARIAEALQL